MQFFFLICRDFFLSLQVSEDGEPVTERMLRASSIDHLLPIDPDSDPNNVLTGFGENLEENFMAED